MDEIHEAFLRESQKLSLSKFFFKKVIAERVVIEKLEMKKRSARW